MARDQLSEVLAKTKRAGKRRRVPSASDLDELAQYWEKSKHLGLTREFVPIRIITILEVFIRHWIEQLVDHGSPYAERVPSLRIDLKFDFPTVRSLQGGAVTLGQLVAHNVSLNRLEAVVGIFEKLLEEDFWRALSIARNRWEIEIGGQPDKPIISDIDKVRTLVGRLFEARHILVHEFPKQNPIKEEEVPKLIQGATQFLEAIDWLLSKKILGDYPLVQGAMNFEARERHEAAKKELQELCAKIASEFDSTTIYSAQRAWDAFVDLESKRQAESFEGGSMYPMVYASAAEDLTRARIAELKKQLEMEKDE